MKITKSKLKQLIKEELESVIQEVDFDDSMGAMAAEETSSQVYVHVVKKYLGQMIQDLKDAGAMPQMQPTSAHSYVTYDLESIASEMAHELEVGLGTTPGLN